MAMVDWSALPEGVVALIGSRIQLIEDFTAFRATCTSWRKGTTLKDFDNISCPKLPLLMLFKHEMDDDEYKFSDADNQRVNKKKRKCMEHRREIIHHFWKLFPPNERAFMNLSKGKTCKFSIPEVRGMECRSSKGWLIMVERKTGVMCLFHLLTRDRIPLPKAPPTVDTSYLICAVLSASPSDTPDYIVMIAYMEPPSYISGRYVGFWKPGNETWTRVEIPHPVEDLNYYNGKFYGLTYRSQVWMIDVAGPDPNNKASKITDLPWGPASRPSAQLVECEGRLLLVAPFFDYRIDSQFVYDLEMGEIDVIEGSYTSITSLGSSTVFLGRSQAFSIDANKFPGILEPNSIYFSDGFYRIAVPGRPKQKTWPPRCWGVWVNF